MNNHLINTKVGVYVDVANLVKNGGFGMRFDVLREFAARDSAEVARINAYVAYDQVRAEKDENYKNKQNGFFSVLRDFGYKVIEKKVKWYTDEEGNRYGKANADLDLAVDALLQSEKLDRVLLATGDGDFVQVVRALQNKGCRVEVVAFENVSKDLKCEADIFISGYLIPGLLPTRLSRSDKPWGVVGSSVRGVCCTHSEKGFGFMRFMQDIKPDIWKTDTRKQDSPYVNVYFHDSSFSENDMIRRLPSRNLIFEFELASSSKEDGRMQAINISLISE